MKTSRIIKTGRLLAAASVALMATPTLAASHGLCGPSSCTLVADYHGLGNRGTDVGYFPGSNPNAGEWMSGDILISDLGGAGWQPVAGDYNNDGFDDFAVYKNGVFVVQWNDSGILLGGRTSTYTIPSSANWGANTIPVSGNWDGISGDDLGIYTDGTFTLFPVITDFSNQISISFGTLPQNAGYIFTQIPFAGPIDGNTSGIDLVGILYGDCVHYATGNVNSSYTFCQDQATQRNVGQVARPHMLARPYVFAPGEFIWGQFTFIMPATMSFAESTCDGSNSTFVCDSIHIGNPATEDEVVIPPDPFQ